MHLESIGMPLTLQCATLPRDLCWILLDLQLDPRGKKYNILVLVSIPCLDNFSISSSWGFSGLNIFTPKFWKAQLVVAFVYIWRLNFPLVFYYHSLPFTIWAADRECFNNDSIYDLPNTSECYYCTYCWYSERVCFFRFQHGTLQGH